MQASTTICLYLTQFFFHEKNDLPKHNSIFIIMSICYLLVIKKEIRKINLYKIP